MNAHLETETPFCDQMSNYSCHFNIFLIAASIAVGFWLEFVAEEKQHRNRKCQQRKSRISSSSSSEKGAQIAASMSSKAKAKATTASSPQPATKAAGSCELIEALDAALAKLSKSSLQLPLIKVINESKSIASMTSLKEVREAMEFWFVDREISLPVLSVAAPSMILLDHFSRVLGFVLAWSEESASLTGGLRRRRRRLLDLG